ncbi:MAG: hypothetical protein AMXMBFR82_50760 [Candidatus Hydrogenedentota bacterium]
MGLVIDLHLHTRRYSRCSRIDPENLVGQAVRAGMDGLVITEHHHQWNDDELAQLVAGSGHPGFLLLAGFEYTSAQGDLLVYGLDAEAAKEFRPGWPPERAAQMVLELGGVCVAAHPTRAGLGFDERLETLPLAAMEVASVNLKEHEQRLARSLSETLKLPATASSDAHDLRDVGRYATVFEDLILSSADLQRALRNGRFQVA